MNTRIGELPRAGRTQLALDPIPMLSAAHYNIGVIPTNIHGPGDRPVHSTAIQRNPVLSRRLRGRTQGQVR